MEKKRVVILGAGISGLAAAYSLQDKAEVVVIEKNPYAGGVMQSLEKDGFFFECGPHTFRSNNSPCMLALINELGLTEQLIASSSRARKRYLLFQNRLEEVPSSLLKWFFSFLCRGHRYRMLSEWFKPRCEEDETIYDFAERRFGVMAAERFFDPLTLGIFGADARELSTASCFPSWKRWEWDYGSVTQGMVRALFRKKKRYLLPKQLKGAPLFSLQGGTRSLVQALEGRLQGMIHLSEEVTSLQRPKKWVVATTRGEYEADSVISALPPHAIGRLLKDLAPKVSSLLHTIPMTPLTGVQLGYSGSILPISGFGFLVPSSEKEKIMGVVFDSEIFPTQNRGKQTRLSVMLRGLYSEEEAIAISRDALERHLGICQVPDIVHVWQNGQAIPVMQIGHEKKIAAMQKTLQKALPGLHLLGNYLGYPSVEECIRRALTQEQIS